MNIINWNEFDIESFRAIKKQTRKKGNPGTKQQFWYKDILTAFDIETTRIVEIEQSVMYIWQWAFGPDTVVIGRTWDDFTAFKDMIVEALGPTEKLLVYVHNLSFEFQFLKGIYSFADKDVFALDNRKVLRCEMDGKIEFRCSYLQTNMSLSEFTDKMGAEHAKLSGIEFDYSKIRYPWTPLSDREMQYCVNDVVGLVEAMSIQMAHDKDNYYTVPMTSTGYCRRDAKKAMRQVYHGWLTDQLPTLHLYQMCREAFRGGNTHGSRFFAGTIVKKVHSIDRSSSYPDVLINCKYPVGRFYEIGAISEERYRELLRHNRAILSRISFTGIRLKEYSWPCPYLSKDKCRSIIGGAFDNGRILEADYLETTITDVDFKIIEAEYEWDRVEFTDVAYTYYGYLPEPFREVIIDYYRRKTALKGVFDRELDYYRSKAKLNSLYGMCAQDPCKVPIHLTGNMLEYEEDPDIEGILMKDNRRRQLPPYQVGVWCTAWARAELEEGIRKVYETEGAFFIYTDTDSIKYTGSVDFGDYNQERIRRSFVTGAFADDPKGCRHYMGVFEDEGTARRFVQLGAKKYCYEDEAGKLHLTVAGVVKRSGAEELEKHGGLKAFKPSFIFSDSGGVEAVYNDFPQISSYEVDGHVLPITSNIVLRPSTYTLGITNEYEYLINICHLEEFERNI